MTALRRRAESSRVKFAVEGGGVGKGVPDGGVKKRGDVIWTRCYGDRGETGELAVGGEVLSIVDLRVGTGLLLEATSSEWR